MSAAVNPQEELPNQSPLAPTRTHQRMNRSNKNQKWSVEDDEKLGSLVRDSVELDWASIAAHFPAKTQQQVVERWTKVLDPGLMKGSWTGQEDQTIIRFVEVHGTKSWTKLAELLPGRIGKQCRERWINHLDPDINHGPFTPEEDRRIIELHEIHGNRWAKISAFMPNRTCNAIKNRWNSTLHKCTHGGVAALPEPLVSPQAHQIMIKTEEDDTADKEL